MEKQFIPSELALELKELGFDKRCFTTYTPKHLGNELSNPFNIDLDEFNELKSSFTLINLPNKAFVKNSECVNCVSAPLWQQAFDWFRDTLLFDSWVTPYWFIDGEFKQKRYTFSIEPSNNFDEYFDCKAEDYDTYEEARLECLKKLIEIVKNDK